MGRLVATIDPVVLNLKKLKIRAFKNSIVFENMSVMNKYEF